MHNDPCQPGEPWQPGNHKNQNNLGDNGRPLPLLRILHISDLHFGPPFVPEAAEAALASAASLAPDVIVVSGDLTQRARRSQFQDAADYLKKFPQVPLLVIPGNHDVPLDRPVERFRNPLGLYRELINENLNPVLRLKSAIIVGLDSTAPWLTISNGRIHGWQLEYCREMFTGAPPEAIKIVVAHHHFAPAPDHLSDRSMLKSKRAIMKFIELDVELILGGHLHRAYIGNSLDFYPGIHRDRGIIIVQSGTTTSRRGRGREQEKNSFNLVEIYPQTINITHHLFFGEFAAFIPVSQHSFRRTPYQF